MSSENATVLKLDTAFRAGTGCCDDWGTDWISDDVDGCMTSSVLMDLGDPTEEILQKTIEYGDLINFIYSIVAVSCRRR